MFGRLRQTELQFTQQHLVINYNMKKASILIIALYALILNSKTVTGKPNFFRHQITSSVTSQDTTLYLKNSILSQKSKFQHKELNFLLLALKYNIKSYIFMFGHGPNDPVNSITLYFEDRKTIGDKLTDKQSISGIIIQFEENIPRKDAYKLMMTSDGAWLTAEKDYYGNRTVKNIDIIK